MDLCGSEEEEEEEGSEEEEEDSEEEEAKNDEGGKVGTWDAALRGDRMGARVFVDEGTAPGVIGCRTTGVIGIWRCTCRD